MTETEGFGRCCAGRTQGGRARWPGRKGLVSPLLCCTVLLLATSCLSIPVPGRDPGMAQETLSWKVVLEKRDPNILLAGDRTQCEVSADRYASLREGDRVFCHWR